MTQKVLDTLVPANGHRWPILEDMYFKGGFRVVNDIAARDLLFTDVEFREGLKPGSLVLCFADKTLWIFLGSDLAGKPSWELYTPNSHVHKHRQVEPKDVWVIAHGKNTRWVVPTVTVSNRIVVPGDVIVVDDNTVHITFPFAVSGECILQLH